VNPNFRDIDIIFRNLKLEKIDGVKDNARLVIIKLTECNNSDDVDLLYELLR
jgi:hypothetical protein